MRIFNRSRPRGVRPEQPSAVPGSNIYPGPQQWGAIELPNPSTNVVMGLPAASRAMNLISNAIAQMAPLELWTPEGFISDTAPTIITRPNATQTCFDFFWMVVSEILMHGNFLALPADFDSNGYPCQLVPVPAGFWLAYIDGDGYLTYAVNKTLYRRDEVFHVRANGGPLQPMGIGVVTQFRRAIGQALDQQNFAADTYRSGSVPAGLLKSDKPEIDEAQAQSVVGQWIENHAGGRAPAVLPSGLTFEALQWTPEDMQFLQARQFQVGEIAHMFGLDPTDLGAAMAGSSVTYANIEQRQQQRITDTYAPIMMRIEQEFSDLIPGGNQAKFDVDNLLRTDSETRAKVHEVNIGIGVESVDEARKTEGKHPLPPPPRPPDCPVDGCMQADQHAGPHNNPATTTAATDTLGIPAAAGAKPPTPKAVPGTPGLEATPIKIKL